MAPQRSSSPEVPQQASGSSRWSWLLAQASKPLAVVRQHPLRAAAVAGSVLAALGGIALGAWFVVQVRGPDPDLPTLETALHELDEGRYAEAQQIALVLLENPQLEFEERGGPLFVLGAAAVREAEKTYTTDRQRHFYLVAARYLAEAHDCGIPPGRHSEASYLFASSEFRAGRYARSIPLLQSALSANPPRKTEISGLLAKAYLRATTPRLAEALAYNGQYLADRRLSPAQRHEAQLERAQIQLLLGEADACAKSLDEIPAESAVAPGVIVMRGRLLMNAADQTRAAQQPETSDSAPADSLYQDAAKLLRQVQGGDGSTHSAAREAQYLLGLCLLRLDDLRKAEAQFSHVRRLHRGTPEALAAALEEADLQRNDGRFDEALTRYVELLHDAGPPQDYRNGWLSLVQLRIRIEAAVEGFREKRAFGAATALVEALPPTFPLERSVELKAELEQAWGKSLLIQAESAPSAERAGLAGKARLKFREAAVAFTRLADMRKTAREFPDDLWRSAQNYAAGQDYRHALRALQQYLAHESRRRRSEALIAIGQSYLALNRLDQALPPLLECVENFRKHPDSYRARLIASQAYLERNEIDEAKALLVDNLENESLTPRSLEWRDSLFALGNLLHRQATDLEARSLKRGVDSPYPDQVKMGLADLEMSFSAYQEAIDRLSEAVQRYPDAPQAVEARYLIAESHRQSAKWPRKQRGTVAIETIRATLARQAQDELNAALAEYEPLLDLLNQRQEKEGHSVLEAALMRNCYFARADVLFDLERFEEAIAAYSSATNRYHDRPEALEAFVQIASCYRRMNRPAEARGTLEQAKVVLRRIPADAVFTQATRYDREEWTQLLVFLGNL